MNRKSELPPGWAMQEDQDRQISETLNKKPISPVDAMENVIKEIARDIALLEPNPHDWEWWVSYLLEQLEEKAQKRRNQVAYNEMVKSLSINLSGQTR